MRRKFIRIAAVALVVLSLTALAVPQLKQAIKILGVGAAVKQFGPDINKEFNKLTGHKDSRVRFTKVVPIITVGIRSRGAIGAAQVVGTKTQVQSVKAVASRGKIKFRERFARPWRHRAVCWPWERRTVLFNSGVHHRHSAGRVEQHFVRTAAIGVQ